MEQEIGKRLQEHFLVETVTDYEQRDDDPEGYAFTEGWALGLTRAAEMLRGGEPLDGDQIMAVGLSHLDRDGGGR